MVVRGQQDSELHVEYWRVPIFAEQSSPRLHLATGACRAADHGARRVEKSMLAKLIAAAAVSANPNFFAGYLLLGGSALI